MHLKPCPSCGDEDIHIVHRTYTGGCFALNGKKYCYAECMPCDMRTGDCFEGDAELEGFGSMEEMAAAKWNLRRGEEAAVQAERERCVGIFSREKCVEFIKEYTWEDFYNHVGNELSKWIARAIKGE